VIHFLVPKMEKARL